MRAAQNGHIGAVELLLDAGADVDAMNKSGYTVLMVASSVNNPDILKILIQHGANMDVQDREYGWTALIWSAKEGYVSNVRVFVNSGADIGLEDVTGMSVLDWALKNGHEGVAGLLGVAH